MKLPATATFAEASALLGQLDDDVDLIDASALQAFDTSTIALILEAKRRAQARGQTLKVTGAPPKLHQLARLYGVEALLSLEAGST